MVLKDFSSLRPGTVFCRVRGEFYGEKMCLGTQRKSRIKVTASVKNVFIIDVL